jgi:outer membrane lipoprotein-sorting protein
MTTAFLLCFSALSAPDELDMFFREFTEKRAGIQMLEADVEERTFEFGEVTLRRGRVLFGKPRRIIFRFENDEPVMMVDGRRVYEHDPLEEQVQIFDIDDSPESSIFFLGFDSDPGALREAYDMRLVKKANTQGEHRIVIRPFKESMDDAPFREVSIYLRDVDFLPYRVDIALDDEVRMVTEFANYKTNVPVEPATTQLRIPAETRIIENGEVVMRSVPAGGLLVPPQALAMPNAGVAKRNSDDGETLDGAEDTSSSTDAVTAEPLPAP